VKREWRDAVETAKARRMYRVIMLSVATTRRGSVSLACQRGLSRGRAKDGEMPELGHGEEVRSVLVPQMIEALAGKTVVGVAAGG